MTACPFRLNAAVIDPFFLYSFTASLCSVVVAIAATCSQASFEKHLVACFFRFFVDVASVVSRLRRTRRVLALQNLAIQVKTWQACPFSLRSKTGLRSKNAYVADVQERTRRSGQTGEYYQHTTRRAITNLSVPLDLPQAAPHYHLPPHRRRLQPQPRHHHHRCQAPRRHRCRRPN